MTEDDEGFLERWSRRKHAGGAAPVIAAPAPEPVPGLAVEQAPSSEVADDAAAAATPAPAEEGGEEPVAEIDEAELPDIESLDRESDYTVFLRKGVPDRLRRAALRKLWRSDPLLANLDGLNDYDEDFTLQFSAEVVNSVKTAYKVGKGFVDEEETVAGDTDGAKEGAEEEVADAAEDESGEDAAAADAGGGPGSVDGAVDGAGDEGTSDEEDPPRG